VGLNHPRVQLLTIKELLEEKGIDYPGAGVKRDPQASPCGKEARRGKSLARF
jgi:hypothetical protein